MKITEIGNLFSAAQPLGSKTSRPLRAERACVLQVPCAPDPAPRQLIVRLFASNDGVEGHAKQVLEAHF